MAVVDLLGATQAKTQGSAILSASGPVDAQARGRALGLGYAVGSVGTPPYAPQLVSPADNSTSDLTDTTWEWTFLSPTGLTQATYAIRFMLTSTTQWMWWNGTGLVSYEVLLSSTSQSVTIPSGVLLNGNSYTWAVRVGDTSGALSPYSQPSLVTGAATPTVDITGPSGTQTVGSVTLTWLNQNVTNVASWQVIVYTQAQTTASGFLAGSSPWVWNSGIVLGAASSAVLPSLPVGTFVAYVQISSSSQGLKSAWTPWTIVFSYTAPAQPTLTATYDTSNQTVALVLGLAAGFPASSYGSVYRSTDGGSTWTVLSSFDLLTLTSGATSLDGTDYTPLATQDPGTGFPTVSYYGVIVGPGGTVSPRSATQTVQPSFPMQPGQAPNPGWTFLDATTYAHTWQPIIQKMHQDQVVRSGVHLVLGDPQPVFIYDVMQSRTLKLTAVTLAETDWVDLLQMLQSLHVLYVTNVYGLVGFFELDSSGYSMDQEIGSVAATIRKTTFTLIETFRLPTEGAGT
jgi:hypothetical protein